VKQKRRKASYSNTRFSVPGFLLVTRSEYLSPLSPIGQAFGRFASLQGFGLAHLIWLYKDTLVLLQDSQE
jgi:hypothetical protein